MSRFCLNPPESSAPSIAALLETLKTKELPDQETKANGSIEGLVYGQREVEVQRYRADLIKAPAGT